MINFEYYSPTQFVFGKDREKEVGSLIKKHGGHKVLVHYGTCSVVKSGLLDRVINSLKDNDIEYVLLGGVLPNPRDTKIYEGVSICKSQGIDFILAVGGGSVIDSAKGIAVGALYNGDVWDFYSSPKPVERALPIGTILTIAAAGSEGSGASVVTREKDLLKRRMFSNLVKPKFSILNPELTYTLPNYQTACGAVDIMAHVFERYFTNTQEVEITDRMCEAILKTIIKEAPIALANPCDYGARANIMWAGTCAHSDIVGVGREQDWGSHALEHELSGLYDVAHGAGLAVIMPSWMEDVYKHDIDRFAMMAVNVFNCKLNKEHPELTAFEGINEFRIFLHSIGMPINFHELGAKKEDIDTLVKQLFVDNRKIGAFVNITPEVAKEIYLIACNAKVK